MYRIFGWRSKVCWLWCGCTAIQFTSLRVLPIWPDVYTLGVLRSIHFCDEWCSQRWVLARWPHLPDRGWVPTFQPLESSFWFVLPHIHNLKIGGVLTIQLVRISRGYPFHDLAVGGNVNELATRKNSRMVKQGLLESRNLDVRVRWKKSVNCSNYATCVEALPSSFTCDKRRASRLVHVGMPSYHGTKVSDFRLLSPFPIWDVKLRHLVDYSGCGLSSSN